MSGLRIERVTKTFGAFTALDSVSLDIRDGEFIAILGPSGCGKTTLLRMVAGFERVQEGEIAIGERIVSSGQVHLPPEDRRIGIVFQSYALWPHMSVAENVGYGLKVAKVPPAQRTQRVNDALDVVGMRALAERSPAQLSGGQRQRVALARCLVTEPSLVLLDEPLANLDVHLRASMQDEFSDFHRRTGTTMFYITHDQAEAMAMADRIAVMDGGHIVQVDVPQVLYNCPATEMVAGFIGSGNVLPADVLTDRDESGQVMVRLLGYDMRLRAAPAQKACRNASICLRPGDMAIAAPGEAGIACRVARASYQGGHWRVHLVAEAADAVTFVINHASDVPPAIGALISLTINAGWVIPDTGNP